jgi:hypothetical protein
VSSEPSKPPEESTQTPPSVPDEYPLSDVPPLERPAGVPPPEGSTPPPRPRESFQFSLGEVFLMAMALAFLLGLLRLLPRNWAAFTAGMAALLGLGALSVLKIDRPIVLVGWWGLLVIYLLTAVAVLVAE